MAFEKIAYWTAVGVLALLVGNHFAAERQGDVNSFAQRSLSAAQQVASGATRYMATAEMVLGMVGSHFDQTQTTVACAQTRIASVQSILAQHEASVARLETDHARVALMSDLHGLCPRQTLKMTISRPVREGTI